MTSFRESPDESVRLNERLFYLNQLERNEKAVFSTQLSQFDVTREPELVSHSSAFLGFPRPQTISVRVC